jgi:hypothetical protein
VELPPEHAVNSFPRSQFTGAPAASEVIWLPSDPEVLWLPPKPGVKWLPSADGARLPAGGSLRLPQPNNQQVAHPEFRVRASNAPAAQASAARRVLREVPGPPRARAEGAPEADENASGAAPGTTAGASRQAERLESVRARQTSPHSSEEFGDRIDALRARILALRPQIASALKAHSSYVDALALRELETRRTRLRAFLEQAQLELAKTYDLATEQ